MVLNILVFNTRSILDYHRRATVTTAVQTKNCYQIICLTETWLTEHISDSALFLPIYEVHRKDRPSDSGNTKHGGVLIPVTKNIPANEILSDFQDGIRIFLILTNPKIICCLFSVLKLVATHVRLISFRNLLNS